MNTEKENTLPEQAEEEICEVEKSIPETEKDTDAEGGDASAFGESPSPPDREATKRLVSMPEQPSGTLGW